MYGQPDTPSIDSYKHLLTWLDFYKLLLRCELHPDNYIFPSRSVKGTVDPSRPMTSDAVQKMITQFAQAASVPGAEYFTIHCFQRGGTQY